MSEDFRQSLSWAAYMRACGWEVERLSNGSFVYIYKLPFLGSMLRIPRVGGTIPIGQIDSIAKKYKAIFAKLEPDALWEAEAFLRRLTKAGYAMDHWSIEPTSTLCIDISLSKEKLFAQLKPKWRQYVRFAQKHGVSIEQSDDVATFINIWKNNARRKGFLPESTMQIRALWNAFKAADASSLLFAKVGGETVAASFLIFWKKTAHLWRLAYTSSHKNLRPLYLLVWEAIFFAKEKGAEVFDFEGIEDPRLPYTKRIQPTYFKLGFGGSQKMFLGSFVKYYNGLLAPFIKALVKLKPDLFRSVYRTINR